MIWMESNLLAFFGFFTSIFLILVFFSVEGPKRRESSRHGALDRDLAEHVKNRLRLHGGLGSVEVSVTGGAVLLRGKVNREAEREAAEVVARSVPQIRGVINEIRLATEKVA